MRKVVLPVVYNNIARMIMDRQDFMHEKWPRLGEWVSKLGGPLAANTVLTNY